MFLNTSIQKVLLTTKKDHVYLFRVGFISVNVSAKLSLEEKH